MIVKFALRTDAASLPRPEVVLELLKPITWFPPMWAFACGAIAVGVRPADWGLVLLGILVAGPLVCASSQAVNDWFDRDVDAINEPDRPIPSGRLPGSWGFRVAVAWTAISLAVGSLLGPWGLAATALALVLAWAYSAPPLRLKSNGWYGNTAVGLSYETLAWITGSVVIAGGALPAARGLVIALLYGIGAHGIMTLNDFKSVGGDRRSGVRSLPVRLGETGAARAACAFMVTPQLVVIGLLATWGALWPACAVGALVLVQIAMMRRFLASPTERATWLSGLGVPPYVIGMMVTAFALRAGAIA